MEIFCLSVIPRSACVPTTESYFKPQLSPCYLPLMAKLIIELGIHLEGTRNIFFKHEKQAERNNRLSREVLIHVPV